MTRRHFLTATATAALAHCAKAAESGRIRIAMIGTGHSHAVGKMESIRALPEVFEVVGVTELNGERKTAATAVRAFEGLKFLSEDEILADKTVPVVAIETTLADSPRAALAAIRAGKHIHLDKPGAAKHADFKQMREEAVTRNLTVQMGYMLRYNPAFELLVRAVREGWLGEITEVDASMGKLANETQRGVLREYPGAGMFELGCHLVDAILTLLGKPAAVHAFSKATRVPGDSLPDNQFAVLEYVKLAATLRCNHTDPNGFPRRRISVAGTKGAMEIEPLESGRAVLHLSKAQGEFKKGENRAELKLPANRYDGEFRDLARVIRGEKKLGWDAAHDIAVHETALRAAGA